MASSIVSHNFLFFTAQLLSFILVLLEVVFLVLGHAFIILVKVADGLDHGISGSEFVVDGFNFIFHGGNCLLNNTLDKRMAGVEGKVISIGELAIETHTRLEHCHILHAAHILALSDYHWLSSGRHGCVGHHKLALLDSRNLRLE